MGIFDAVTGFFGKIADGVVHTVAPGCSWKPSSLIQQAGGLLPSIIEAIPTVGPLLSHAIPAISAIFGGSDKQGDVDAPKLPDSSEVRALLNQSLDAIAQTRQQLSDKLDTLIDKAEKELITSKYEDFVKDITPAIQFLRDSMSDLTDFVPFGANARIENFVTFKRDNNLELGQHHQELKNAVANLEQYLTSHIPTQDVFDLYILASVWLLTYDKMVLTLRSYLAQHYLKNNAMTKYTSTINAWNEDFRDMRVHAKLRSAFILGDPELHADLPKTEPQGFIEILKKKRMDAIGQVAETSREADGKHIVTGYKFDDSYPKYGLGYVGRGDPALSGLQRSFDIAPEQDNEAQRALISGAVKGFRTGYAAVNTTYFDLATRAAIEAADTWRRSLTVWQSRLPLTPPPNETQLVTSLGIYNVESALQEHKDLGPRVGEGWKTGETLSYAVSYVTNFGEGFLSTWSEAISIKAENQYVKLELAPVAFHKTAFQDKTRFAKKEIPGSLEVEIVRRIYVQVTFHDETLTYIVGETKGPSAAKLTLWDQAHGAHPTPVYTLVSKVPEVKDEPTTTKDEPTTIKDKHTIKKDKPTVTPEEAE